MSESAEAVRRFHPLVTPEGVALELRIPAAAERIGALIYDTAMIVVAMIVVTILTIVGVAATGGAGSGMFSVIFIVALFLIWNGYFIYFESQPGGATPGKRRLHIRVMSRSGGALRVEGVVARNLTRNFEFAIPALMITLNARDKSESHVGSTAFLIAVVILAMIPPLFLRSRLRVGDLLGGTIVVAAPAAVLLQELGRPRRAEFEHTFTREQLSIYGIYELQVLEDLLHAATDVNKKQLVAVSEKIRNKIGYKGDVANHRQFLRDFYAAQRAHLEHDIVLGKRKESKAS